MFCELNHQKELLPGKLIFLTDFRHNQKRLPERAAFFCEFLFLKRLSPCLPVSFSPLPLVNPFAQSTRQLSLSISPAVYSFRASMASSGKLILDKSRSAFL